MMMNTNKASSPVVPLGLNEYLGDVFVAGLKPVANTWHPFQGFSLLVFSELRPL